ncbi:MAG: VOC family protein [Armatimonadetes bacterium]|nr:VOC family protein [Armatimonadota bacterium]
MRLDHVNIVVSDMERSCRFYGETLGLRRGFECFLEGEWIERVTGLSGVRARCVFFEFPAGGPRLELLQYENPTGEVFPAHRLPHTLGARHIAFEMADMDGFVARLKAAGVPFLSDPVEVPFVVGTAGRKRVCYFHDPDGVLLEAAAYEK